MMKKYKWLCVVVFTVVGFSLPCYASAKWQYLVKSFPLMGDDNALSAKLNELGDSEWELVNCTADEAELTCVFKKPVE